MKPAHIVGWGMLVASSLAGAADDPSACPAPQGAVLASANPMLARKFSLALASCAGQPEAPAPAPAALQARQLYLYDEAAMRAPAPAAPAADAAPLQPSALSPRNPAPPKPLAGRKLTAAQMRAVALAPKVQRVAQAYDIDPLLLHAIAHVESRHNPQAVSHAGAMGLMQVMPATARRFGVSDPRSELLDPEVSLEVGSAYLKTLQGRFGNKLDLILAAYNAGEGAVERYGRSVPPYAETRGYVHDVLAEYLALRASIER